MVSALKKYTQPAGSNICTVTTEQCTANKGYRHCFNRKCDWKMITIYIDDFRLNCSLRNNTVSTAEVTENQMRSEYHHIVHGTIDMVWIGEWADWPLIHTTGNYKPLQHHHYLHNSQMTIAACCVFTSRSAMDSLQLQALRSYLHSLQCRTQLSTDFAPCL
jgi:hypothetical protein